MATARGKLRQREPCIAGAAFTTEGCASVCVVAFSLLVCQLAHYAFRCGFPLFFVLVRMRMSDTVTSRKELDCCLYRWRAVTCVWSD